MKFLANENFPNPAINKIRSNGFYVKSIAEELAGISDNEVLDIAKQESLIILTFDKDYGELIFRYSLASPPGVVFFRYKGVHPSQAGIMLIDLIKSSADIGNSFTIIDENSIRQRKYR